MIYPAGRPPWFNILQHPNDRHSSSLSVNTSGAYMIGIAGGSASGKTSVSEMIIKKLDVPWVVLLSMDSFYKALGPHDIARAHRNEYNFDDPNAFDYDLLVETLVDLKEGRSVKVPIYDFKTHSRLSATRQLYGANVVIFEGIYGLYDQRVVDMMDMRIFVDTDDDIRLSRRLRRDIAERGRDLNGVLQQYMRFVKPSFDQWIKPTMRHADVIVPRGADNVVAIELLTHHISRQLDERGFSLRSELARLLDSTSPIDKLDMVYPLKMTPQLKFIHTMIRDKDISRDDFIFYAERLSRLIVEDGLNHLPFASKTVTTPTGHPYNGLSRESNLCGVSIVRAGLTMERPLRKVCPYISIGRLLIQTSPTSHEPHLHFCHLPKNVASSNILLMDATISTGAAMVMALRVLIEHGVAEERIVILCLIASPLGLKVVGKTFPKVRIVVSEVDANVDPQNYHIVPGLGNVGDRYFGTA
eukprot:Partr_v1_DN27235_c2_g1_i2_m38737 putative uridine kinase